MVFIFNFGVIADQKGCSYGNLFEAAFKKKILLYVWEKIKDTPLTRKFLIPLKSSIKWENTKTNAP